MGHQLVDAPAPYDAVAVSAAFETLWSAGAAAELKAAGAFLKRAPGADDIEPATFGFARLAGAAGAGGLEKAVAMLTDMAGRYLAQFDAFDVLMTPVLASAAPQIGQLGPEVPFDTLLARLRRYVGYTPIENAVGAAAISLPMGMSSAGLPIGIQFTAPPGGERRLLELAYGLEAARPWTHLRPALWAA
jgi:amidase